MKQTKKEQILDSALTLFSEKGIDATSTASIAKAAGVATGTLFHHFPSKQALVHELYLSIKQDLSQQFAPVTTDTDGELKQQACALWNNAIDWAIGSPQKLRFFQMVSASQLLSVQEKANAMAQELGVIFKLIELGQASQEFAKHPMELLALNCQGLFFTASNFYIDNPQYVNDTQYRQSSFDIFWNALRR